jgi:LemA protein
MVAQEQAVNQTWAQVETQYQRRFDLIPNLQAAVEGAANFEKSTFTAVTEARTKWMAGQTINDKVAAANDFNSALSRLLVTVESYPQLKATQQFADFMVSLEGTENRVAVARKDFNDTATVFNITIKSFPTNLLAGFFGFSEKALFKSSQDAANAPKVKFGN